MQHLVAHLVPPSAVAVRLHNRVGASSVRGDDVRLLEADRKKETTARACHLRERCDGAEDLLLVVRGVLLDRRPDG